MICSYVVQQDTSVLGVRRQQGLRLLVGAGRGWGLLSLNMVWAPPSNLISPLLLTFGE